MFPKCSEGKGEKRCCQGRWEEDRHPRKTEGRHIRRTYRMAFCVQKIQHGQEEAKWSSGGRGPDIDREIALLTPHS